jgi:hypothetical protein
MLSTQNFIRQIFAAELIYRRDNAWVGKWSESWNDPVVMRRFIEAAYKLYSATATNALQLTLLGGTEIRLDRSLVRSFGVTAANGIQDQQAEFWVAEAMRGRHHKARLGRTGPAASVTGSGSILSKMMWTPILNDSLIIGAITGGQDYVLAFTPDEQRDWEKMHGSKVTKTQVLATRFGETTGLRRAWKEFFNAHPKMFCDDFGPRVFTRELLGLCWFGYKPDFSWHQLGFAPGSGRRAQPKFSIYLERLNAIGFQHPCNKRAIARELSTFLFDDASAMGATWA